jgi:hypothetical protein
MVVDEPVNALDPAGLLLELLGPYVEVVPAIYLHAVHVLNLSPIA